METLFISIIIAIALIQSLRVILLKNELNSANKSLDTIWGQYKKLGDSVKF